MADLEIERKHVERIACETTKRMENLVLFSAEEEARQGPGSLAPLQKAISGAQAAAKAADEEAIKQEALANVDPLSLLTTDELVYMDAARPFVQEEIAQLIPEQFGDRLTAVATRGHDNPEQ